MFAVQSRMFVKLATTCTSLVHAASPLLASTRSLHLLPGPNFFGRPSGNFPCATKFAFACQQPSALLSFTTGSSTLRSACRTAVLMSGMLCPSCKQVRTVREQVRMSCRDYLHSLVLQLLGLQEVVASPCPENLCLLFQLRPVRGGSEAATCSYREVGPHEVGIYFLLVNL
eukprot:761443-Hanusia_phi.AAC.5